MISEPQWADLRRKLDRVHLKLYSSEVEDALKKLPLHQLAECTSRRSRLSSYVASIRVKEFEDISAKLSKHEDGLKGAIQKLEDEIASLDSLVSILKGINVLIGIIADILPVPKLGT